MTKRQHCHTAINWDTAQNPSVGNREIYYKTVMLLLSINVTKKATRKNTANRSRHQAAAAVALHWKRCRVAKRDYDREWDWKSEQRLSRIQSRIDEPKPPSQHSGSLTKYSRKIVQDSQSIANSRAECFGFYLSVTSVVCSLNKVTQTHARTHTVTAIVYLCGESLHLCLSLPTLPLSWIIGCASEWVAKLYSKDSDCGSNTHRIEA